jgi:tetratricopeptide (TPR) repeat protein
MKLRPGKPWLMAVCSTLFCLAAWGQNAPAASTNAASVDAYLHQGSKWINDQKPAEALKAFEQAAALDPNNEPAAVGQYISLVQLKRTNDGAKILDKWVAAKPDDPRRWLCKGMCEAQTDRPAEALKSFEKLAQLQPNEGEHWIGIGECLTALNRNEEALQAFDKALKMRPERTDVWSTKGGVQAKMGKYDDALTSCNKAIELLPRDGANYTNAMANRTYSRACVYALKGDKTNALADLKQAIELDHSCKSRALKDGDFRGLYRDPDFKKLTE